MAGINFMQLPALQANRLLNFSPVNDAVDKIGNALRYQDETAYKRAQDAKQEARAAASHGAAMADRAEARQQRLIQNAAGIAQMIDAEQDPAKRQAMWGRFIKSSPTFGAAFSKYGMDPNDHMTGPKFLIAQAQGYTDPLDRQLKEADLANKQAQTQKLQNEAAGGSPVSPLDQAKINYYNSQATAAQTRSANATSPLERAQLNTDVKRVSEYTDAADGAEEQLGNLARLKAARSQTNVEGPLMDYLPNVSTGAQQVQAEAENVRLGFVQKTKGAVSDAEMRIFGLATPGTGMTDEAAAPVIQGMEMAAERVKERALFFDQWLRARGSLEGALGAWNKFIKDKPIIRQRGGAFEILPENVRGWESYIPTEQGPGARNLQTQPMGSGNSYIYNPETDSLEPQ